MTPRSSPFAGRASHRDCSARHLLIVLGDQLNLDASLFDGADRDRDVVWMAEAGEESTHVWSHPMRIAIFLAAMRHMRDRLVAAGWRVAYQALDDPEAAPTLAAALERDALRLKPERLIVVEPGEYRVKQAIEQAAARLDLPLDVRVDRHFLSTLEAFDRHAKGRKQLRLEYFYRELRRKTGVLMTEDGQPVGGAWNFDKDNRSTFGKAGPPLSREPVAFAPDPVTRDVLALVASRFADHPGSASRFDWPVTPEDAAAALADFIEHRLPAFGEYQDAMWTDQPWLFHARLSAAMNLKLLDSRVVITAAVDAYHAGHAPLNAVEGFVRQILGWREYVRGVYWRFMPDYLERNALNADRSLPDFYWTGDTDMACLRQVIGQTLEYGYAHHIQRLMVTGLFALLLGVQPQAVHAWYLAVYVDAVEWVEAPNTLGMSQFADGGIMASKPYCATGKYIQRMSNYCDVCRYRPDRATGDDACPFTTLYWDFLARSRDALAGNQRLAMQLRNVDRKAPAELAAIREHARKLIVQLTVSAGKAP